MCTSYSRLMISTNTVDNEQFFDSIKGDRQCVLEEAVVGFSLNDSLSKIEFLSVPSYESLDFDENSPPIIQGEIMNTISQTIYTNPCLIPSSHECWKHRMNGVYNYTVGYIAMHIVVFAARLH